jgi:GNAT superfamily N-acetyltransferase
MPDFEVREVDVHDEAQLHRWWQAGHDAMAGRAYDLFPSWENGRAVLPTPHGDFDQMLLAAHQGDAVVGVAMSVLPVADNLTMSYADVMVPPDHRRRGIGSALLAAVEQRARSAGRAYVVVEVPSPLGAVGPGELFAEARGYPVGNREGIKLLDLADHPDWSALAERAAARGGGYTVEEWGDRTPEQHARQLCDTLNQFVGMTPTGDLALEDIALDPERLRRNEERAASLGRRRFCAAAFAPDGMMAGYTDLWLPPHEYRFAEIGITMVLPEHRGHALGLRLKLATHAALVAAAPECGLVTTNNADVNQHMNAVNEQLGYRLVEQVLEVQKTL